MMSNLGGESIYAADDYLMHLLRPTQVREVADKTTFATRATGSPKCDSCIAKRRTQDAGSYSPSISES